MTILKDAEIHRQRIMINSLQEQNLQLLDKCDKEAKKYDNMYNAFRREFKKHNKATEHIKRLQEELMDAKLTIWLLKDRDVNTL